MRNLRNDFANIEKDVSALMIFAFFLVFLFYLYAIYFIWIQKIEEVLKVFMPFGALISAVLVAKVASRLLTHNKVTREEDDCKDIVRITHHLIAIVSDMRERVGFSVSLFRDGGKPWIVLIENAVVIEKRYEVLLDREAYRFLKGESVELIGRMSGSVFALTVFAKALAETCQDKINTIIPISEDPTRVNIIEQLESLLKELDLFEVQIRQLRGRVE
ncbi:MAG: hypothetical protein R8K20_04865 [Gallionellaceae bacterium]